jgi:dCMP deaminase
MSNEQHWPTYRPSLDDTLIHCAYAMAARGTCERAYVGVVFALEGRIISSGYNGAPVGKPHCEHYKYTFGTYEHAKPVPDWVTEWSNQMLGEGDQIQLDTPQFGSTLYYDNGAYTYLIYGSKSTLPACDVAVHAEQNAITFAARHGISLKGSTLYSTMLPCQNCAHLVIDTGVVRVVAAEPRKNPASEELLHENSVEVKICGDVPEVGSIH